MSILGRVLQVIGWLWMAASVLGRFVELPDFNFFPGLILVFVSRVLRTQNRRRQPVEEVVVETAAPSSTSGPRRLNTERSKEPQQTISTATIKTPPKAPPPAKTEMVWPKDQSAVSPQRDDLNEQLLVAGSELERAKAEPPILERSHDGKPLTSAEMIARARERWDPKP